MTDRKDRRLFNRGPGIADRVLVDETPTSRCGGFIENVRFTRPLNEKIVPEEIVAT